MKLRFVLITLLLQFGFTGNAQDCSKYFQLNELARGNKIDTTYQFKKINDDVSFIKGNGRIFLKIQVYGNEDINHIRWPISIELENGEKMEFTNVNVTSSLNTRRGFGKDKYKYRAVVPLDSVQLAKFKEHKLKSVQVDEHSAHLTRGNKKRIVVVAGCIESL